MQPSWQHQPAMLTSRACSSGTCETDRRTGGVYCWYLRDMPTCNHTLVKCNSLTSVRGLKGTHLNVTCHKGGFRVLLPQGQQPLQRDRPACRHVVSHLQWLTCNRLGRSPRRRHACMGGAGKRQWNCIVAPALSNGACVNAKRLMLRCTSVPPGLCSVGQGCT